MEKTHTELLQEELNRLEADDDSDQNENEISPETDKVESEATETETEEPKEETEVGKEVAKPVTREFLKEKAVERQERRHVKMSELEKKVDRVFDMLSQDLSAKQKAEQETKLAELAKEYQTTPEVFRTAVEKARTILGEKVEEPQKEVETESPEYDSELDPVQFNHEWEEFVPELVEEFPKATAKQLLEVKKIVEEEAYKNENINRSLSDIFSNRKVYAKLQDSLKVKKSFETSDNREDVSFEEDLDEDITSTAQAQKWDKKIFQETQNIKTPIHRANSY